MGRLLGWLLKASLSTFFILVVYHLIYDEDEGLVPTLEELLHEHDWRSRDARDEDDPATFLH